MSEFKGTPGKWEHVEGLGYVDHIECNGEYIADIRNVNNVLVEINANAKLISHAPEMLEMLKEIHYFKYLDDYPVMKGEINELITKATTV